MIFKKSIWQKQSVIVDLKCKKNERMRIKSGKAEQIMQEMYYYWLHNVPGIGRKTFQKILRYMTPKELHESKIEKLNEILTRKQMESIQESKKRWNLQKEWEILKKRKINLLILGGKNYPEKLAKISDAPPVLYQKGKPDILSKPSVAVIGARACSNYGKLMAKELGRELAKMEIVTVSGMARGIDSICQWTSLENGGESIGVLGCGVEVCYPPENRMLFERLQKEGGLISENAPFTKPDARLFPLRNRLISGLADVVVVVEAREKSGTLITVDMALEQGKEVYAIPGRMTDPVSIGCNRLIKQGAGMILSPQEFLEEICPILKLKYKTTEIVMQEALSFIEIKIVEYIGTSLKTMEEIYQEMKRQKVEISLNEIMETVLNMQMKKIIKGENGYYFCDKISVATRD